MSIRSSLLRASEWLYGRAVLARLPSTDHARFGLDMAADFRALWRQAHSGGPARLLRFMGRELWGGVRFASRERRAARGTAPGSGGRRSLGTLRQALRSLARSPGYSTIAVITLSLGIGSATAIFSIADVVLFRSLPYAEPDRLLLLSNRMEASGIRHAPVSGPDYKDYRDETTVFSGVSAALWSRGNLTGQGPAVMINRGWVSANFFQVLGVQPALGRTFRPEEEAIMPDGPGVQAEPPVEGIVLSHQLWQTLFGGDEGVIGRRVELNTQPVEIIGIMPRSFRLYLPDDVPMDADVDAWSVIPIDVTRDARDFQRLTVFARLGPDASLAGARHELETLGRRHRQQSEFHEQAGVHIEAASLQAEAVRDARPILLPVMLGVGLLLLIACANVSNLMLVRGSGRSRERAIRAALGSGRARLVWQFVVEGSILAVLAAVIGTGVAILGVRALVAIKPEELPHVAGVPLDLRALGLALGIALVAALVSSAAPAIFSTRSDIAEALRQRTGQGRGHGRMAGVFVAGQVGLSLTLVVGAALLTRSLVALQRVDLGFEADRVVAFKVNPPFWRYRTLDDRVGFLSDIAREVRRIPGVRSAGGIHPLPMDDANTPMGTGTGPYGLSESGDEWRQQVANYRAVLPGFIESAGLRILSGRAFDELDNAPGAPPRIVIDQTLVESVWGMDVDPVGRSLLVSLIPPQSEESDQEPVWAEVIGVVDQPRITGLTGPEREVIFHPARFIWPTSFAMVMSVNSGAESLLRQTQEAVANVDAGVAVDDFRPLQHNVDAQLEPHRFALTIMGVFAAVAMTLAAVGLYGVLSFSVAQRRQEIGVKLAFGAGKPRVRRELVSRGLRYAAAGIVLGLAGTWALSRVLASMLYEVSALDVVTLGASATLLLLVAASASWLPAVRAARIDPAELIREE